jgi:hypothetical protein
MNMSKRTYLTTWLAIAIAPVVALWIYEILKIRADYNGTCGLLDAGWTCTRSQYVEYTLLNAFVFPTLAIWTAGWIFTVVVMGLMIFRLHKRRNAQLGAG